MSGDWGYGTVFKIFVWGYVVGGLTLLPAVAVLAWFWFTTEIKDEGLEQPRTGDVSDHRRQSNGSTRGKMEDETSLGVGLDEEILKKLKRRTDEPDTFAGYFAVCREYVPGGVNGKPPDRTTPAGAVVSMESPSVYQSMYRSIFDRNKAASPSIDAANARNKKARNVFYVVLRLGHLMLYDNEDQLEVRHVISLAHYHTDVYAGGEKIPEGELWIKRNCIRLFQRHDGGIADDTKSFYLFSDNCSEKEDFYHAMLQAQDHHPDYTDRDLHPLPLKFDTPDLVKLVQQLHASEENLHTRWINALIGRVFLGLYKTQRIKDFIANKITKKIARVPKPALISSVTLRSIDMGTLPPFLTNPKLKELTVDGDLVVEADVSYKGNFRIEIAAIARIELGTRFKAREVTLVLATILKRLEGHLLIRIKPPPSNRLWLTFETPPRMELSVEPIVSSRQITYGVILRAIESRIREVLNETLVLPNWDDMPFTDTLAQIIRGGIWENGTKGKEQDAQKAHEDDIALENATIDAGALDEKSDPAGSHVSLPTSIQSDYPTTGTSSSAEFRSTTARPRPMRSSSSAAQVHLDSANASAEILREHQSLTPTSVRSLPLHSPMRSPLRSDKANSIAAFASTSEEDVSPPSLSAEASDSPPLATTDAAHARGKSRELTAEDIASAAAAAAAATSAHASAKKTTFNQSLNTATAAARNWLTAKQNAQTARKANTSNHQRNTSTDFRPPTAEGLKVDNDVSPDTPPSRPELHTSMSKSHTEPMGRGHPLPPPGTPLPRPEKRQTWAIPAAASTFANIAKRKPVGASQTLTEKRSREPLHSANATPQTPFFPDSSSADMSRSASDDTRQVPRRKSSAASSSNSVAPPPLPKRRQRQQSQSGNLAHRRQGSQISLGGDDVHEGESLFVVEAPVAEGSVPSTPIEERRTGIDGAEGSGAASLRSEASSDREKGDVGVGK